MKRKLFFICFSILFFHYYGYAQTDFDSQVKKMSDTLVHRLYKTGKKRITVASFQDMQGNVTELGKYLAELFSIELSNTDLEVVDRSRLKDLLTELKLTEEKLTKPENALKLGEMAGVEYIITGTITTMDATIEITMKALDIQKGISIAGQRASLNRNDGINNLMRSTVSGTSATAANTNVARKIDTQEKSAIDDLFETRISDLRRSECVKTYMGRNSLYGQVCFENQTGEDLYFTCNGEGSNSNFLSYEKVPLPQSARNCSALIVTNRYEEKQQSVEIIFTFHTTNGDGRKGNLTVSVESCKVKSIVLTTKNLLLMNK